MKLLVPALLLFSFLSRAAAQSAPTGAFEALYAQAVKDSAKLFEGKDKSLAEKAPGVLTVLGQQLPKDAPAAAEARKKLTGLEKTLDDAIGIQQGTELKKLPAQEYEKKVRKTAQVLGVDEDKAWALYRPAGGPGGPGSAGAFAAGTGEARIGPDGKPIVHHVAVSANPGGADPRATKAGQELKNAFGPDRRLESLGTGGVLAPAGLVKHGEVSSPNAPASQLPHNLNTHVNEVPAAHHEAAGKKEEPKGWQERWGEKVESFEAEHKAAAAENRRQGAEKLAKAMDPNLGWWEKAKLRASAGMEAVSEYGNNLAAGDRKTWRNTALAVGGVAVAVAAAPVVAAMAAGTTAVTAASVGGVALHAGLAGLTGYAIVQSGNELAREPNLKNAAMFALAAAPVGLLEHGAHAVVASKAVDTVAAYAGKAMPILRSVGETIAAAPGISKAVEAGAALIETARASKAAVKVAEVGGEIAAENAGHLAHAGVHMSAEAAAAVPAKAAHSADHTAMVMTTRETAE